MDMLVKLWEVKEDPSLEEALREEGILLKRAMTPDMSRILAFVRENFSEGWAGECTAALLTNGCWIAVKNKEVVGFACFDATQKDFFGPTGVRPDMRGKGVGKALLIRSLISMRERGYAYAIIGWTGPQPFYKKVVGAIPIPESLVEGAKIPGSYLNLIDL